MTFDFIVLFNSFPSVGVPNPIKDKKFRQALVKALADLDAKDAQAESAAPSTDFVFSEREYILQQSFLESRNSSEHVKNRAADWILTAWEKGYIKNAR